MKIIDILNKIANGEAPKKILFNGEVWEWGKFDYKNENNEELFDEYIIADILNDEVEILYEPKEGKIEKLDDILRVNDLEPPYDSNFEKIWCQTIKNHNKINEIIDKLNGDKE